MALVLVHFGDAQGTRRCLESLATHEAPDIWVIVVNHGPGLHLAQELQGAHPNLILLENLSNPGFGAGCNLGAQKAWELGVQYVWFLNNDAWLDGPVLKDWLNLVLQFPQVALWGCFQREGERRFGADLQPSWYEMGSAPPLMGLPASCRQLLGRESLSGASILIHRKSWENLGPWPENFFLYWEDAAWCLRAHRMGLPIVIWEADIQHERSRATGKRSPLSAFYGLRNSLRLHGELHPEAHWERWIIALHTLQKRLFQGRWSLLPSIWRGMRSGLKGELGPDRRI